MKRNNIQGTGGSAEARAGAGSAVPADQTPSLWTTPMTRRGFGRRAVTIVGGGAAAALLGAACGRGDGGQPSPSGSPSGTPDASPSVAPTTAPAVVDKDKAPAPQIYDRTEDGKGGYFIKEIDVAKMGPDIDQIVSIDITGDVPTGATIISGPKTGASETRLVCVVRTSLEKAQFRGIGGDVFPVKGVSDADLDQQARDHAKRNGDLHPHIKTVYIGDLALFEQQWGKGELPLLHTFIRAQTPPRPDLGIPQTA